MPMNLPETGGGKVKWGVLSSIAGRMLAEKSGNDPDSFAHLATWWVEKWKVAEEAIPCCMMQGVSRQDLLVVLASLAQQQLGSENKLMELPFSSEQCGIVTRKPIEDNKIATTTLRLTNFCTAFIRAAFILFSWKTSFASTKLFVSCLKFTNLVRKINKQL